MGFFVEKGSVAVDGISLTIVDVLKKGFTVVIIPHTAKLTTMGFKGPGDTVNIEVDILAKYVEKLADRPVKKTPSQPSSITKTLLKEHGFI